MNPAIIINPIPSTPPNSGLIAGILSPYGNNQGTNSSNNIKDAYLSITNNIPLAGPAMVVTNLLPSGISIEFGRVGSTTNETTFILNSPVSEPRLNIAISEKAYTLANQQRIQRLVDTSSNISDIIATLLATIMIIVLTRRQTAKALSFNMRAALNTIIGFSTLLNNSKSEPLTLKQNEYPNEVRNGSNSILQLITV